ncbi:MAG: SulP family inorganic anion transporter [Bacteroidota bacterium]|jgi:MFS superfamily sulfate permease-like transporter
MKKYYSHIGANLSASIVVLLVALPLCLGIALASGAPLFSGIIAGVVGGIVVGLLSGSQLSVSGPAAGLTAIVAVAILKLQVYEAFLLAVVLAGVMQVALGYLKAGVIGDYIPNAVIKGMLAAIGLILIMKQFPHLVGYDANFEGDETFAQADQNNTFSAIYTALNTIKPAAAIIGLGSIILLSIWEKPFIKKNELLRFVPGPLVVVILAIIINGTIEQLSGIASIESTHLVSLPIAHSTTEFISFFTLPKFSFITNVQVWISAVTLAIVASLETLLGIEAVDKLDPLKRVTPTNKELKAQGFGNIISGLIGGLPLTSVIVRSSANVSAGGKTKQATIFHGLLLLLCAALIPNLLNKIPLSALAGILIFTGYKLAKITLFKEFYQKGLNQFIPFCVTIIAILFTDLLIGISIGIAVSMIFIIRSNFKTAVLVVNDNNNYLIRFKKDVSFLNKPIIKSELELVPENANLVIDVARAEYIDKDVIDEVNSFLYHAHLKNIKVALRTNPSNALHRLFLTIQNINL